MNASSTSIKATPEPVSVLFVCLGNICRSPMAEGIFRSLTHSLPSSTQRPDPRFGNIDSAGTGAYHSLSPPDHRTVQVLRKHGISDYEHAARKVRSKDFTDFQYILAMDAENLDDLIDLKRDVSRSSKVPEKDLAQVLLFGSFGAGSKDEEVADPYYGGAAGFQDTFVQLKGFSEGFLEHVCSQASSGGDNS